MCARGGGVRRRNEYRTPRVIGEPTGKTVYRIIRTDTHDGGNQLNQFLPWYDFVHYYTFGRYILLLFFIVRPSHNVFTYNVSSARAYMYSNNNVIVDTSIAHNIRADQV